MSDDIRTYSIEELEAALVALKQPKFRAKQLYEWLHTHHARSFDEMSNLPKALRESLAGSYSIPVPQIADRQVSTDGTRKYVLSCSDGMQVETVGMPVESEDSDNFQRLTVCFSTQIGCAMECAFCATGKEGFSRNLSAYEMVDQIITVQNDFDARISNVVAMGQGEPFLNYDEVMKALRIINSPTGLNIGARHITVSTCGILDGIRKFGDEPEQFTLAISLHSAIQDTRNALMPRVANQTLPSLKKALKQYVMKTNRRVTLEYLLIKEINDQPEDLEALLDFCSGLLCHVNILPMNKVEDSIFQPASKKTASTWLNTLEANRIEATMRKSRGSDIDGACGQLKNSLAKRGAAL